MTTLNDHRTLSTFSSSKNSEVSFVGFRLKLCGDVTGRIDHRMSLDELDLFMRNLAEERQIVVEFEATRGKPRKKAA